MPCVLLISVTSVAMLGTLPPQLLEFTLRSINCSFPETRVGYSRCMVSINCSFPETRVGYSRCTVSRGVWHLSGSWCGAFVDAIVSVHI